MGNSSISESDFCSFLGWYLSSKSDYVFEKEPWNEKLLSSILCSSYKNLKNIYEQQIPVGKFSSYLKEFDKKDYENKFLEPILRIQEGFKVLDAKQYLADVVMHGSMATLDYKPGWSDVDISVILSDRAFSSWETLSYIRVQLNNLSKNLYQIDPLQHHGFLISSDVNQVFTKQPQIPTIVLLHGKSLLHRREFYHNIEQQTEDCALSRLFQLKSLFEEAESVGMLRHHSKNDVYLDDCLKNPETLYQLKYFLGIVMNLPCYYFEAIGQPVYKKYSFKQIEMLENVDLGILHAASNIREKWTQKEIHPYPCNRIPDWVKNELGSNYFSRAKRLVSELLFNVERYKSRGLRN